MPGARNAVKGLNDKEYVTKLLDECIEKGKASWNGWHSGMRKIFLRLTDEAKGGHIYKGWLIKIVHDPPTFMDNAGTEHLERVKKVAVKRCKNCDNEDEVLGDMCWNCFKYNEDGDLIGRRLNFTPKKCRCCGQVLPHLKELEE